MAWQVCCLSVDSQQRHPTLYAGRVITLGTLIAIYLSTSDEMLPILISEKMDIRFVLGVLGSEKRPLVP